MLAHWDKLDCDRPPTWSIGVTMANIFWRAGHKPSWRHLPPAFEDLQDRPPKSCLRLGLSARTPDAIDLGR